MSRSSGLRLYAAIAALGLAVAGCAPLGLSKPGAVPETGPAAPQVAAPKITSPEPAPPPEPASPPPRPPPPPPPPDPDTLVGLDATALRARLGAPGLTRREPPAEVWLYEAPGCVLHVFLYAGADGVGPRVTDVEATAVSAGHAVDARACFAALLEAAGEHPEPEDKGPVEPEF